MKMTKDFYLYYLRKTINALTEQATLLKTSPDWKESSSHALMMEDARAETEQELVSAAQLPEDFDWDGRLQWLITKIRSFNPSFDTTPTRPFQMKQLENVLVSFNLDPKEIAQTLEAVGSILDRDERALNVVTAHTDSVHFSEGPKPAMGGVLVRPVERNVLLKLHNEAMVPFVANALDEVFTAAGVETRVNRVPATVPAAV